MPDIWTGQGFDYEEPRYWDFAYGITEKDGVRGLALVGWGEHLPLRAAMKRLRDEQPHYEWATKAIHGTTIRYIAHRLKEGGDDE